MTSCFRNFISSIKSWSACMYKKHTHDENCLFFAWKQHRWRPTVYVKKSLRQPSVLSQLVNYIVSEKTHTTSTKSCAYVACEILSAGVPALLDGLVYAHPELLTMLWALLDQSHKLSPRQMVGFCRVNAALMEKRPGDLIRFIQAHDDIVSKWIHHIFSYNGNGCPYLSDLLVALTQSQQPSGEGTSIVQVSNICCWIEWWREKPDDIDNLGNFH